MAVENGGYLTNADTEKNKIKTVVEACIDLGIYVIIDWHDHNAQDHTSQAVGFFEEMASLYGNNPNVLYEIYNETEMDSWDNVVKPYAETVISAIRAIDPDNIIIVGTSQWSQLVDQAADNPINGSNIVYTAHFYAATHKQSLRDACTYALNKGVEVFISEWGTCEHTGDGTLDYTETETWINYMKDNMLSWCNWSIVDKNETSAALHTSASSDGGWSSTDLTTSGALVRDYIRELNSGSSINRWSVSNTGSFLSKDISIKVLTSSSGNHARIFFYIPQSGFLTIKIYTMAGSEFTTLVKKQYDTGNYSSELNTSSFPNGIYLCKIALNSLQTVRHIQIIK